MSDHLRRDLPDPDPSAFAPRLQGLEYATKGGWLPAVSNLIRWLRVAGCFEYVHLLEREVQSLPRGGQGPEAAAEEFAALTAILDSLAYLHNEPPRNLATDQVKELVKLRRAATRFVRYRLRQLAGDRQARERAERNMPANALADLQVTPACAAPAKQPPPPAEPPAPPEAARPAPAAEVANPGTQDRDLEVTAIGLLFKYPDWSIEQIADHLGVDRSTPYRWPRFREAAKLAKKLKPRKDKGHRPPRGHKAPDGTVEAYDESGEEPDEDD
jgi:hypothetical protein